jgi:hypothetical protein
MNTLKALETPELVPIINGNASNMLLQLAGSSYAAVLASLALIVTLSLIGYIALRHRHVPMEAVIHPPEMRCLPPKDMLDMTLRNRPPGLCPDFHHLDV